MGFGAFLGKLIKPVLSAVTGDPLGALGGIAKIGAGVASDASSRKMAQQSIDASRDAAQQSHEWFLQDTAASRANQTADEAALYARSRSDQLADYERMTADERAVWERGVQQDQASFDRSAALERSIYDRTRSDGLMDAKMQFSRLREAATEAGFNPLTVLGATGGASSFGGGSSGAFASGSGIVGGGVSMPGQANYAVPVTQAATFTRDTGLAPLSSVGMLANGLEAIGEQFSPEARAMREQTSLKNDLMKIELDQLRSGVRTGPPKMAAAAPARPKTALERAQAAHPNANVEFLDTVFLNQDGSEAATIPVGVDVDEAASGFAMRGYGAVANAQQTKTGLDWANNQLKNGADFFFPAVTHPSGRGVPGTAKKSVPSLAPSQSFPGSKRRVSQ